MNEGTHFGFRTFEMYAEDLTDYVDKFDDKCWDEEIIKEYGEEFFYKFDEDLFNAIRNAIQDVVSKYK